jgi:hypothetical protein
MYKRNFDSFNVTLLHLYFQNYIVIVEMERFKNGEDLNSVLCLFFLVILYFII